MPMESIGPGAMLVDADLSGGELAGRDLTGTTFVRCRFVGADLSRATLVRTRFEECDIDHARVQGAEIDGTLFVRCQGSRLHEHSTGRPKVTGPYAVIAPPRGVYRAVTFSEVAPYFAALTSSQSVAGDTRNLGRRWSWPVGNDEAGVSLLHMHLLWYFDAGRAGGGSDLQLFASFLEQGGPPSKHFGDVTPEDLGDIEISVRERLPRWVPPAVPPLGGVGPM